MAKSALIALTLFSILYSTVSTSQSISPASVAGCYAIVLIDSLSGKRLPPSQVELRTDRGTRGLENGKFLARSSLGEPGFQFPFAYWDIASDEIVVLVWTTGYEYIKMELQPKDNKLVGNALRSGDVLPDPGTPRERSRVELLRKSCQ